MAGDVELQCVKSNVEERKLLGPELVPRYSWQSGYNLRLLKDFAQSR